jgi:hypothetical protein
MVRLHRRAADSGTTDTPTPFSPQNQQTETDMANAAEDITRDHAPQPRHARTMQRRAATASLIGRSSNGTTSSSSAPLPRLSSQSCSSPTPPVNVGVYFFRPTSIAVIVVPSYPFSANSMLAAPSLTANRA